RYVVTLLATSATGALQVTDPDGEVVAQGNVATAITTVPGITTFTVADGGTRTVGDQWYIDVTGNAFLGISIAHQALGLVAGQTADEYAQYENVAILTGGAPIYVEAGEAVVDGGKVFVDGDGNFVDSSGVPLDGWVFD